MNPRSRLQLCLLVFLLLPGCRGGCGGPGGGGGPSAPATLVLAWVGTGGQVKTLESTDGQQWHRSSVDPQATTTTGTVGPAIAHDGSLTWMLMWVNGPELQYKIGIGGLAGTTGINWEQRPTVG